MAKLFRAALVLHSVVLIMSSVGVTGLRRGGFMNISKAVDYRDYASGVVTFGDSTVDVGNNNYLLTVVKSNFEPYGRIYEGRVATGRFCDGKLTVDLISETIGYPPPLPYLAPHAHGKVILTGINFASSASGWYESTAANFNVKGLADQLLWYENWKKEVLSLVGEEKGNFIIGNALYVVSTGANDWVNNYYVNPALMRQYTLETYTPFLVGLARSFIQELYDLGGRNIAVLGLPPLGCLPSQITLHGNGKPGCVEEYNDVSIEFNAQFIAMIDEVRPNLHGGRLIYLDIYTLLDKIVKNPQPYGISETRNGCCGTGVIETAILCNQASIGTCEDGYPYLWWDSFHPTDHVNSLLSDDLFKQVEPNLLAPPQP